MTISFVDGDGGTLAVETEGSGPLVVCSPAMGDVRAAFRPLAERLVRAGHRVALLDLRGHGDSSTGFRAYGDEATARDLIAVIEHLGGGPAVLVGASMSAAAAVIAAGRRPELVAGLVLAGPFLRNGGGAPLRLLMRCALLRPWGPAVWRAYSARLWPGLGDSAAERAAELTVLLTRPGRWRAFQATSRTDHAVTTPWIPSVTVPVLVVMGTDDPDWRDPRAEASWATGQFRDADLALIPGAGHAPMLERPEETGQAVLGLLAKVFPPASEGADA